MAQKNSKATGILSETKTMRDREKVQEKTAGRDGEK